MEDLKDTNSLPIPSVSVGEALTQLGSSLEGISSHEAARRLLQYGPNELPSSGKNSALSLLLRQFKDPLVVILIGASILSAAVGEYIDASVILAIVCLNGLVGFAQEWRAEKALDSLKAMLKPFASVIRDGKDQIIPATELVPGDITPLRTGDRVSADMRVIESIDIAVDESALTGESLPVSKTSKAISIEAPLAEHTSAIWMGTNISSGRGIGLVFRTGLATEFGRIATMSEEVETQTTHLQHQLGHLSKILGFAAIVASALIGVIGIATGKDPMTMVMTAISLAVAVVPEGLPAVVTVTLGLGIRNMVRQKALLRRMQAAESIGAATVICTDKTGTLTANQMTVISVHTANKDYAVTGTGYNPKGVVEGVSESPAAIEDEGLVDLISVAKYCNNSDVVLSDEGWVAKGEATEAALSCLVKKFEESHQIVQGQRQSEIPFSSSRKRMSVVIEFSKGNSLAMVKGAPDQLLDLCRSFGSVKNNMPLTSEMKLQIRRKIDATGAQGYRTLGLASRQFSGSGDVEGDLVWHGFVAIVDPPRPEVAPAIQLAMQAGIRIIMITGDAAATAAAIAKQIGLDNSRIVSGNEIDQASDSELKNILTGHAVFARATPEHKIRIVTNLQELGEVAAMTGDGVNDAPALKKADIGIAMGIRGTDVARGSADIVLTDDNFASIIGAVEEGRRQFANIKKFVGYLLTSNFGELIAIGLNILLGGPLILLPAQILWINLVTDGITAVALGLEPSEKGSMSEAPVSPKAHFIDRSMLIKIVLIGGYMGVMAIMIFQGQLEQGASDARARTMAFVALILAEKFNVLNFRSLTRPLSIIGFTSNKWILIALAVNAGLLLVSVYVPMFNTALGTVPLQPSDWLYLVGCALPIFVVGEVWKRISYARKTS